MLGVALTGLGLTIGSVKLPAGVRRKGGCVCPPL